MAFNFSETTRFYCYSEPVDMRKGIHSLYSIIKTRSEFNALGGDAYIFISASRKSVKVIRWHNEGFVLYHKKLELGLYTLPRRNSDTLFFEMENKSFEDLICSIKHRSIGGELRRNALLIL